MNRLTICQNEIIKGLNKRIFNMKAEKLSREASDNFIYFKRYDLALKLANEALELEPYHTKTLMLKGDILLCIDKDIEALDAYSLAVESEPFNAQAYGAKAGVLDMLGRPEEALDYCSKAFEFITEKDSHLLVSLFDQKLSILHTLGKSTEAKEVLDAAQKCLCEDEGAYLTSCYEDQLHPEIIKINEITNYETKLKLVY